MGDDIDCGGAPPARHPPPEVAVAAQVPGRILSLRPVPCAAMLASHEAQDALDGRCRRRLTGVRIVLPTCWHALSCGVCIGRSGRGGGIANGLVALSGVMSESTRDMCGMITRTSISCCEFKQLKLRRGAGEHRSPNASVGRLRCRIMRVGRSRAPLRATSRPCACSAAGHAAGCRSRPSAARATMNARLHRSATSHPPMGLPISRS